jgi:hypothetical protein
MEYKDDIITGISKILCKDIEDKVINNLKSMKDEMQSGEESGLQNLWEELCVQVQDEQSVMWELYVDIIYAFIEKEVEKLPHVYKKAIWLQTSEGKEWAFDYEEDDEQEELCYNEENINDHILNANILCRAANYSNERIDKFLERELD